MAWQGKVRISQRLILALGLSREDEGSKAGPILAEEIDEGNTGALRA